MAYWGYGTFKNLLWNRRSEFKIIWQNWSFFDLQIYLKQIWSVKNHGCQAGMASFPYVPIYKTLNVFFWYNG